VFLDLNDIAIVSGPRGTGGAPGEGSRARAAVTLESSPSRSRGKLLTDARSLVGLA